MISLDFIRFTGSQISKRWSSLPASVCVGHQKPMCVWKWPAYVLWGVGGWALALWVTGGHFSGHLVVQPLKTIWRSNILLHLRVELSPFWDSWLENVPALLLNTVGILATFETMLSLRVREFCRRWGETGLVETAGCGRTGTECWGS